MNVSQQNVAASDPEFIFGKAHRRRTIATPTALMKDQLAIFLPQLIYNLFGLLGNQYAPGFHASPFLKKGGLKETHSFFIIRNKHVFCLSVVIERHQMSFASET